MTRLAMTLQSPTQKPNAYDLSLVLSIQNCCNCRTRQQPPHPLLFVWFIIIIIFNTGGAETTDNRLWFIVDVRDVAEALLLVYDKKEASGRYICASHPVRVQSLVEKLKTKYPCYNYPKK